jgi:hypothetical protein
LCQHRQEIRENGARVGKMASEIGGECHCPIRLTLILGD